MSSDDLSNFSMEELFRAEADGQCQTLSSDLLALEKSPSPAPLLESLMRAAHSLKGAARIIGLDDAVTVSHAMEEIFVAAQKSQIPPSPSVVDILLGGVDLLRQLSGLDPGKPSAEAIAQFKETCAHPPAEQVLAKPAPRVQPPVEVQHPVEQVIPAAERRNVRLDSERLDNLLGLAGQATVASQPEASPFAPLRSTLRKLQSCVNEAAREPSEARRSSLLSQAASLTSHAHALLVETSEAHDRRSRRIALLNQRIYNETLACRMRPFGDITGGLRRLARDLARELGKEVDVEIVGEETEVDRDLLDRLDGPLSHLIRNALDHGIELPETRRARGKNGVGKLTIRARHKAGWLVVGLSDDGAGLDDNTIRAAIVRRGFASAEHAALMSEAEVYEFLLLPGFSLREEVTEISGRGVGLDAVRVMAHGAGGSLRLQKLPGSGILCEIILPVSLSLVRALLVGIGEDVFALPLSRVDRVLQIRPEEIQAAAGRQHFYHEGERIELLSAARVLELASSAEAACSVVVLQGPQGRLALAFDRFAGLKELSIQRLDPQLGRVQSVSATALLDDGTPVVLLDANDVAITAANFSAGSRYQPLEGTSSASEQTARRILVAEDSLTVRELERKLLANQGYSVDTAVDGADAWHALRSGTYDLLVTDIDMPRLDGIELCRLVRADARLRDLPIVVVSYKDRPEDRNRGLEAGADFYLPKSSYQDESLIHAVKELIGEPLPS
jgi:two-component system sensor histidine kinase and response regulator WspE